MVTAATTVVGAADEVDDDEAGLEVDDDEDGK
jgi:hypothetical protein